MQEVTVYTVILVKIHTNSHTKRKDYVNESASFHCLSLVVLKGKGHNNDPKV